MIASGCNCYSVPENLKKQLQRKPRGVGKGLLDHIKGLYSSFFRNVYQKNTRAVEFYLREGLVIASEGADEDTGEADYEMAWKDSKKQQIK